MPIENRTTAPNTLWGDMKEHRCAYGVGISLFALSILGGTTLAVLSSMGIMDVTPVTDLAGRISPELGSFLGTHSYLIGVSVAASGTLISILFHVILRKLPKSKPEVTNEEPYYSGEGIPFESTNSEVGKIVSILFSRPAESATEGLISSRNIKNVFYETSPEFLTSFQKELQHALIYAFNNRESTNETLFTLFIHQTLSLLPFAYPKKGFEIQIPVNGEEGWELQTYTLDKRFELGNPFLLSPMPAYGLKSENGPPMLIFMGTTYPAGEGFLGTLLSDFTPGHSVGSLPFHSAKEEIEIWLEENPEASAMGISLGGAFSLHAAKTFGQKISKVYAYVPPGLYQKEVDAFKESETEINVVFQDGDFVSTLGFLPEGKNVHLYNVVEEEKANPLSAHARIFLSGEKIKVFEKDPQEENQRPGRKLLTRLHLVSSPIVFLCILPLYLVASLFKLINEKTSQTKTCTSNKSK